MSRIPSSAESERGGEGTHQSSLSELTLAKMNHGSGLPVWTSYAASSLLGSPTTGLAAAAASSPLSVVGASGSAARRGLSSMAVRLTYSSPSTLPSG